MIEIFYFDRKLRKAEIGELGRIKNKRLWIDVYDITAKESQILQKAFKLHPVTVEDIENPNTRIKVEDFVDYLFCIFYGCQKKKGIELVELDFILGRNYIITNHKAELESFEKLKKNKKKLGRLLKNGTDFILHQLIDIEIDNFFPVLEEIDDEIEDLEEAVTKKASPGHMSKILDLKRQIISIKKTILPQREKLSFLARKGYRFISDKSIPYFRDVYDHSIRVYDLLDNQREAISNTFDVYMSSVSNNMNEVMKVLTVFASIFIPLTFIAGVYGMNFRYMPELEWRAGYFVVWGVMIVVGVSMLAYFKKKNWI